MRDLASLAFCAAALLTSAALAEPIPETYFSNDKGAMLYVGGVDAEGFDFTLSSAYCPEGETTCLEIYGRALRTERGYTWVSDYDPASRIFFADSPEGVRVLQTAGDLGTGTANRAATLVLVGNYLAQDDGGAEGLEADFHAFQSPTGNIGCLFVLAETTSVRCDLAELTPSYQASPDCDLDYGSAFLIEEEGVEGVVLCHGDTVLDPGAEVLSYGSTLSYNGVTCRSEKTGITCMNPAEHGFALSRRAQEIF